MSATMNEAMTDARPTIIYHDRITLPVSATAAKFAAQGYGKVLTSGKVLLSMLETVYLHDEKLLLVTDSKGKALTTEQLERRASKTDKRFSTRLAVFRDFRKRGYVVKTGLKYGAEFVVYDRGMKPGDDHSRWVVYPVHEREHFGWHDFSAKNRVAHTTQKRLLIAIVDDDGDVIYYEARWMRP